LSKWLSLACSRKGKTLAFPGHLSPTCEHVPDINELLFLFSCASIFSTARAIVFVPSQSFGSFRETKDIFSMYDDPTQFFFPSSGNTEVPLIFDPKVVRCLAAGSGGKPIVVLLDTGTDPSAIDLRLAKRLGLQLGEFAMGSGAASDAVPFAETILPWLSIGSLTLRHLQVLALNLQDVPFHVDIVLGYNVLCQVVLKIDYIQNKVKISHPDLGIPEPSPSGALLPLTFFEHFPALSNLIVGDGMCLPLVTIDTGSNGGLTLGPDLAKKLGLQPDSKGVTLAQGAGFGSTRNILRGYAESIIVGPFIFSNVHLDTPGEGAGDLSRPGRANMGNNLLSRFASVTFDYGRRLCRLEIEKHLQNDDTLVD
jgi:hypothetical protein